MSCTIIFRGYFWDSWTWNDAVRFRLLDEDGNSFYINVPIGYPGAVRRAPEMAHLLTRADIVVRGWYNKVPLYGTIELDYTVYSVDWNCFPPKHAPWAVVGLDNVVAWPTGNNSLHAAVGWTLLDLHGNATITLMGVSEAGGPVRYHDIPLSW